MSGTVVPAFLNFFDLRDSFLCELWFSPELHASIFGFGDAVHLPLSSDVILELRDQRKNAHYELARAGSRVDRRIIRDLEGYALLGKL
jgi:hypothetical protein